MADDYESYSLPQLLDLIKNLGQPATLQTAEANWEGLAGELVRRIGFSRADSATLTGLIAAVAPHWKGSGADAYGQHVNDLSNYGIDVAARAYLTNYGAPSSNFATFHSATDDAHTALTYVKQQAAQIVPLTDDNAKSGYLNSLSPPDRASVEIPSRFPNPAREQAIQHAVTTYQTSYNEALRQQALQLLNYLSAAYTSIADNLPTKAPGNPPTPTDTSTAVSSNGVGLGSAPGLTTALAGSGPTAQITGGQTSLGPAQAGHLSGAQSHAAHLPNGSPAVGPNGAVSGVVPSSLFPGAAPHPLAASGFPSVPSGTPSSGPDPTTQLANFTPPTIGSGPGSGLSGGGLVPFGSLPASTGPGLANLPGLSGLSGAGLVGIGPGGAPLGGVLPGGLAPGAIPGGILPAGLAAAGLRSGLAAEPAVAGQLAAAQGAAAANDAATAERAAATGAGLAGRVGAGAGVGGMPMMPYLPMSPMGGYGTDARDRRRWLDEDEDVWADDTDLLAPPVIGRIG
jgi:hypothetical protein